MSSYAHTTQAPRANERQPSLKEQGVGQQDSRRNDASGKYSATDQQRDKAKLNLASPTTPGNDTPSPQETPPLEVPQQDDRPERYPVEDRQVQDAEANRRS